MQRWNLCISRLFNNDAMFVAIKRKPPLSSATEPCQGILKNQKVVSVCPFSPFSPLCPLCRLSRFGRLVGLSRLVRFIKVHHPYRLPLISKSLKCEDES
ncbi:hypothetical protein J7M23_07035 [Candidatus Sumerlaeota bacterium]|nr:hypothetical protein [Candidatus Sumerlaeota bacterium]